MAWKPGDVPHLRAWKRLRLIWELGGRQKSVWLTAERQTPNARNSDKNTL
jgi:hypothetical protein